MQKSCASWTILMFLHLLLLWHIWHNMLKRWSHDDIFSLASDLPSAMLVPNQHAVCVQTDDYFLQAKCLELNRNGITMGSQSHYAVSCTAARSGLRIDIYPETLRCVFISVMDFILRAWPRASATTCPL